MGKIWRRRNYFIKKDLQGRYIFSFFVLVIAGGIVFTAIFSLLSSDTFTVVYRDHNLRIGRTPVILIMEILRAHWIFIVLGGAVVVIVSMFLTHRVAGPLYRFERSLEEMKRGNLNFEIRLRRRDEGKELSRMINEFNSRLSSSLMAMKDLSGGIETAAAKALQAVPEGEPELRASLEQVRELNKKLNEILQSYALKND